MHLSVDASILDDFSLVFCPWLVSNAVLEPQGPGYPRSRKRVSENQTLPQKIVSSGMLGTSGVNQFLPPWFTVFISFGGRFVEALLSPEVAPSNAWMSQS